MKTIGVEHGYILTAEQTAEIDRRQREAGYVPCERCGELLDPQGAPHDCYLLGVPDEETRLRCEMREAEAELID